MMTLGYNKDLQYYKFCLYGFFKNLRFFDPFLILFFLDKGISFLEIGFLYSAREIVIMIMEIPSGIISDALGRRRTLIASFFFYIISFLTFYFSSGYITIMTAMILFAVADSFRTGVHKAMIFDYLKVNNWSQFKIGYYGHTRSWSQTGSAVSALIAAAIVYISGNYKIIFIASVIPYIADMLLVYSYPSFLDGKGSSFSSNEIKQRFTVIFKDFLKSISSFQFFRVLTNLSIYTGFYRIVRDYVQPMIKIAAMGIPIFMYMEDEKKVAIIVGIIYSVIYLLSAVASKNTRKFTRLFNNFQKPMNYTLLIGFSIGILIGLSSIIGVYAWAIIGFILIIIIENLRKPIGIGLVADLSKDDVMATTLSFTSQSKSIFAAIIAPTIGLFADLYNPGISIAIVSIILILLSPIYWLRK